jgi:hypothetical protein
MKQTPFSGPDRLELNIRPKPNIEKPTHMNTAEEYMVLKLVRREEPPQRPNVVHIPNAKGELRMVTEEEIGDRAQTDAEHLLKALSDDRECAIV